MSAAGGRRGARPLCAGAPSGPDTPFAPCVPFAPGAPAAVGAPWPGDAIALPPLERAAQLAAAALEGRDETARVAALCAALRPRRVLLVGADAAPDATRVVAAGEALDLLVWTEADAERAAALVAGLQEAAPPPGVEPDVHVYRASFSAPAGAAPHPVAIETLAEVLRGPGFDLVALEPPPDEAAFRLALAQVAALVARDGVLLVAPLERCAGAERIVGEAAAEGLGRSVLWAPAGLAPAALVGAVSLRRNHGATAELCAALRASDPAIGAAADGDPAALCALLARWLAARLASATADLALPLAALPPPLSVADVVDLCARGEGGVAPLGAAVTLAMLYRAFDLPATVAQFGSAPDRAQAVTLVALPDGRLLAVDPVLGWIPSIGGRAATWPELRAIARRGDLRRIDPPPAAPVTRCVVSLAAATGEATCLTRADARRVAEALGALRACSSEPRAVLATAAPAPIALEHLHRDLGALPLTGDPAADERIARAVSGDEVTEAGLRFAFFHTENPLEPGGIQGGAESALLSLTRALAAQGHAVTVVGRLARDEERDGVRFLSAGAPGAYDVAAGLARIAGSCDALVSTMRGDVLIASRSDPALRARILWSHTTILEALHAPLPEVAAAADAILAVSRHQADALARAGAPAARLRVLPNGVDPALFRPRPEVRRARNRVVFAGAIVFDKGLDLLIDAMPAVRALVPDAELVVCGAASQWGRDAYFDQAEVARQLPYVHFRGALRRADLAHELCAASLCVVPTPPERYVEAFGLASLEAQACGTPVIVTRNGGLIETLREGETGWVVSPCTREALAAAVVGALADPDRLQRMGVAAARWAHAGFSWRRNAEELAQLAREVAERSGAPAERPAERAAASAADAAPADPRTTNADQRVPAPAVRAASNGGSAARVVPAHAEGGDGAPIALLTTWRQPCGLARYAEMLVAGLPPRSVVVLAERVATGEAAGSHDAPAAGASPPAIGAESEAPRSVRAVERIWRRGAGLEAVAEAAARHGVRLLHVNHHGSLFGNRLSGLLERLAARGVRSVVTMHAPNQLDPEIAAIGRAADRILVHGEGSRLEVIANGVDPAKVEVVPQGFPEVATHDATALRAEMGLAPGESLLVTPGFVQPHKGVHEVIRAVGALRERLPIQFLVLGGPIPGDASGAAYLAQCEELAARLGVRDRLTVAGAYVSEASLRAYLRAADAIALPYLSTWWESSATARDAISSGRPVITSSALAFLDLGGAVFRASAGFPLERAIELVLTRPALAAELVEAGRRIAERDAWPRVAERHRALYAALLGAELGRSRPSGSSAIERDRARDVAQGSEPQGAPDEAPPRVHLLLREHASRTGGGDFVLARAILRGVDPRLAAVAIVEGEPPPGDSALAHLFNFATFALTRRLAEACVERGLPFVASALYEDWPSFKLASEARVQQVRARLGLAPSVDLDAFARMHEGELRALLETGAFVAAHARSVIASGASEAARLERDFPGIATRIVPTAAPDPGPGDPDAFVATFGTRDFVLCVGRIEPRKNQAALLEALVDSPLDVVLATGGTAYRADYLEACRAIRRRGRTLYLPELTPEQLAGAYRAARVHVLPSWFELPGLVTLEALRAGCAVVGSDRGTLRDHLGDSIPYAPPDDPDALRRAIEGADGWSYAEARRRVEALTLERQADAWAEIYRAFARRSSKSPCAARQPARPLVSVFTNCKNAARTIAACLASVEAQDHPGVEHVIQDGGSTDGTLEILRAHAVRHPGRVKLVSEPDSCPAEGFFRGLARCSGEIVATCASDEALLPDAATRAVEAFAEHPEAGAIYGDMVFVDGEGRETGTYCAQSPEDFVARYVCHELVPPFAATFFRRDALRAVGLGDRAWDYGVGEFELWLRLGLRYPVYYRPGIVTRYGTADTALTRQDSLTLRQVEPRLRLMERLFADPEALGPWRALAERAYAGLHLWIAEGLIPLDALDKASAQVGAAMRHAPHPDRLASVLNTAFDHGRALLARGEAARALAWMDLAIDNGVVFTGYELDRARALAALGRTAEAMAALRRELERNAGSADALRLAAELDGSGARGALGSAWDARPRQN